MNGRRFGEERGPSGRSSKDQGRAAAALACPVAWCGGLAAFGEPWVQIRTDLTPGRWFCSWPCAAMHALKQELRGGEL